MHAAFTTEEFEVTLLTDADSDISWKITAETPEQALDENNPSDDENDSPKQTTHPPHTETTRNEPSDATPQTFAPPPQQTRHHG